MWDTSERRLKLLSMLQLETVLFRPQLRHLQRRRRKAYAATSLSPGDRCRSRTRYNHGNALAPTCQPSVS